MRAGGSQCYIATGDRDSLQLIGKNTTVLLASSRAGKSETVVCDEAYFREKYGTEPQGLVDIKALMGDSSDNIPGVPGHRRKDRAQADRPVRHAGCGV